MPDVFTKEKSSEVMSRIRNKGTTKEKRLLGLVAESLSPEWDIQENVRRLPGVPDILIPSLRLVIFANGCFYHLCPIHGRIPNSNRDYWEPKLIANRRRDIRNRRKLRAMGLSVWQFWEHDLEGRLLLRTARVLDRRLSRRRDAIGV